MDVLNQLSDQELVQQYADGVNAAFDVLLARYKRKVFSYILLSVKDRDAANDIFQETFIKAIATIRQRRYSDQGKFSAWIMRIAHNLIIDNFRRQTSENTVSGDEKEEDSTSLFESLGITERNVEDEMVENQVYKDIKRLMNSLPENQREVLYMRFYQDLSFKEIADTTGVSINTALGRMRYGLMNLRRLAEDNHITLDFN